MVPENHPAETVYQLVPLDLSKYLPSLRARGPGGRPGRGIRPERPPARGSTAFHPRLTLISNPLHPDNRHQTIVQPPSPPDLKIPFELRLPNVVFPGSRPAPKSPVEFQLDARIRSLSRSKTQPASPAPVVSSVQSELAITLGPPLNPLPSLALAAAPPLPPPQAPQGKDAALLSGLGGRDWDQGGATGLLILSVDPAPPSESIALPPGNRYGAFSVSPAGGQPGSPGGIVGGDPHGGTGGAGEGGDGSTGVGGGKTGGGGGGSGANTTIGTISGTGAEASSEGAFSYYLPEDRVYPVSSALDLRRGSLIVTTGPVGGGGLRIYGILRGGKIYTIYLPMPGRAWILQYCQTTNRSQKRPRSSREMVVQLDHGLVPPQAEKKFDFHRAPIPADKADELIILHGVIRADGSIGELRVLQGVRTEADQAALAAFGRWQFKPALQTGKPVAVEILVGIPATL